jgi:hypothetical protein
MVKIYGGQFGQEILLLIKKNIWIVRSRNIIVGKYLYNQFTDKNLHANGSVRKYYC